MSDRNIFTTLPGQGRIWAVAAIHGDAGRLAALHGQLIERLRADDQIVYLGNYLGRGADVRATVDELLRFRRLVMAHTCKDGEAIVFLRGAQEEMWQKLLQLQFATNPAQVLQWMAEQGVDATIRAYGGDIQEGFLAAREGILPLTRWTSSLREAMRQCDGHNSLLSALRHAAFTGDGGLLFVHAGIDPGRPLSAQVDTFWWGAGTAFAGLDQPYSGFLKVVRGYDHRHGGPVLAPYAATIDAGCGFGGPLLAVCFDPDGNVVDQAEG